MQTDMNCSHRDPRRLLITTNGGLYTIVNPPPNPESILMIIPPPPETLSQPQLRASWPGPQWATKEFPYLGFLPARPKFGDGDDQMHLRHINYSFCQIPIIGAEKLWNLDPEIGTDWARLQERMDTIINILVDAPVFQGKFRSMFYRPSRRPMSYIQTSHSETQMRSRAMLAQHAFRLLIAETSWHIAKAMEAGFVRQEIDAIPIWIAILWKQNTWQAEMDVVRSSIFANMAKPRRGVFVDAATCGSYDDALLVYARHHIPLVIYWGNKSNPYKPKSDDRSRLFYFTPEELAAASTVPFACCPPPKASQRVPPLSVFFTPKKLPLPEALAPSEASKSKYEPCDKNHPPPKQLLGETFEAWLLRRTEDEATITSKESEQDRQKRIAREKYWQTKACPGASASCLVYEWIEGKRTYVIRSATEDVWDEYTPAQMRYSSVFNEWDLAYELAPNDPSPYDDDDGTYDLLDFHLEDDDRTSFSTHPREDDNLDIPSSKRRKIDESTALPVNHPSTFLISLPPESVSPRLETMTRKDFMATRYGFCPSLEVDTPPLSVEEEQKLSRVRKALPAGLTEDKAGAVLESPYARALIKAFSNPIPSHRDFDFERLSLSPNSFIVSKTRDSYNICWSDPAILYSLTTDSLSLAHIARAKIDGFRDIVALLLRYGCSFRLLSRVAPSIVRLPEDTTLYQPREPMAWRREGFRPKSDDDFQVYEVLRTQFLRRYRPVLRAALMKGGLAWRLTVASMGTEALRVEEFLDDPEREGYQYDLAPMDWELLIGMYRVYSDRQDGVSIVQYSWFPKDEAFGKSAFSLTSWSESAENWYQARLEEIRTKHELYTAGDWQRKVKGFKPSREIFAVVREQADVWADRNSQV